MGLGSDLDSGLDLVWVGRARLSGVMGQVRWVLELGLSF